MTSAEIDAIRADVARREELRSQIAPLHAEFQNMVNAGTFPSNHLDTELRALEYERDAVAAGLADAVPTLLAALDEALGALEPFAQRYQWDTMDLLGADDIVYAYASKPDEIVVGTPVMYVSQFERAAAIVRRLKGDEA